MTTWYTGDPTYDTILTFALCLAGLVFIGAALMKSPYGRFASERWGVNLSPRLGWFLMELPAMLSFVYFYFQGRNRFEIVPLFFLLVWVIHYGNRGFVFPYLIRSPRGAKASFSITIVLMGWLVTTLHGYLNAAFISDLGQHFGLNWFSDPRFIVGILLYYGSFLLNLQSDAIIRNLRSREEIERGDKVYRIPRGGLFRFVTNPSYLTEITAFAGFAIATWSLGATFILLVTIANLVPRALQTHRWYRDEFPDYPTERRALIPSFRFRGVVFALIAVAGALSLTLSWAEPDTAPDEIVLLGGEIVTMSEPARVEALWIRNGHIERLGAEEEVLGAAGTDVPVVRIGGGTLMPGFIEPHTHPLATALLGSAIDVSGFHHDSRADIMKTLREATDGFLPQPWIIAFGWDPIMVPGLDPPTLQELDELSPDKPLVILTQAMHEAFANSAALQASGITPDTPDPPGAAFGRDQNGELTGDVLEVHAINYLLRALPPLPPALTELILRWKLADYARAGFTTVGVLGPVGRAEDPLGLLKRLGEDPHVPVRSVVYGLPDQLDLESKLSDDHGTRFELRGVKFWMDGSPFTGGAAFAEPYADTELTRNVVHLAPGHLGPLNYRPEEFAELFERYHSAGYHIAVHTQGERAVQLVLDTAEPILRAHPWPEHRHRLEHDALITAEQIRRARSLGFELSFFPDHIYFYGDQLRDLVGDRVERYMPVGTAFREGHRATIHSDNPMTPIDPLRVMRTALLRAPRKGGPAIGPDEAIGIDQALRAMTTNAAWQLGVETHRGSLEPGKAADFVLLSRNPLDTPAAELADIEVLGTWIDGQPVDTRKASLPSLKNALRALWELATR